MTRPDADAGVATAPRARRYDVVAALREGLAMADGPGPEFPVRRGVLLALWLVLGVLLLAIGLVVVGYAGVLR